MKYLIYILLLCVACTAKGNQEFRFTTPPYIDLTPYDTVMFGLFRRDTIGTNPSMEWHELSDEHQFLKSPDTKVMLWQHYIINDTTTLVSVDLVTSDSIAFIELLYAKWHLCSIEPFAETSISIPSPVVDTSLCITYNFLGTRRVDTTIAWRVLSAAIRSKEEIRSYPIPTEDIEELQFGGHLYFHHSDTAYEMFTMDPNLYFELDPVVLLMSVL